MGATPEYWHQGVLGDLGAEVARKPTEDWRGEPGAPVLILLAAGGQGDRRWFLGPSQHCCALVFRMDQEFSRRLSMSEVKDDNSAEKTLSAAARRSFFRRKHKHKRSGSKDGKDLLALDTFSNDSIPLFEGK